MLAVLPVLFIYLIAEFLVFKPLIPHLPLRYQQRLPEPLQMLAQTSKKSVLPHDYVLILGDSFAAGWGDWLETADPGKDEPYATHDLLHQMTGRDVVHSGFAGASPLGSLIRKPVNRFRYLRKMWLYHPEDPEHILWFFYEGNDLYDNIDRLKTLYKGKFDESRLRDKSYFRNFLETEAVKSDKLFWEVRKFDKRLYYQLPMLMMLKEITENLFKKNEDNAAKKPPAFEGTNVFKRGAASEAMGRGDVLCPPVHLSRPEKELSLYMIGESVDYLRSFFPKSKFTIIYIPSVATSYPVTSEKMTVREQASEKPFVMDTKTVFRLSDETFRGIQEMASARGISVIDTRPAFQEATSRLGLLHGPLDFYHLNRQGYEVLAEDIISKVDLSRKQEKRP